MYRNPTQLFQSVLTDIFYVLSVHYIAYCHVLYINNFILLGSYC